MEKNDLVQYRQLSYEVRCLRRKLKELEDSIYSPSSQKYSLTPRASSGQGRTMDDVVASHAALEEFYLQRLAEKNAMLLAVEQAIEALPDPDERTILRFRYIDGYSWRKICQTMLPRGISERQVYRMHGWALGRLKEV